jgi:membrane protein DedA with SNARE-associated domain
MAFEILGQLAQTFSGYYSLFFILAFIAAALFGDGALIFLTAFAFTFRLPIAIVFIACYLGSMTGDVIWFLIGRRVVKFIKKSERLEAGYDAVVVLVDKLFKKSVIFGLCLVKFLYGTRVITTIYLSHHKKLKLRKFIEYNLTATLFWLILYGTLGILVGMGLSFIVKTFKDIQIAIMALIIFLILFDFIQRRINKWIRNFKR